MDGSITGTGSLYGCSSFIASRSNARMRGVTQWSCAALFETGSGRSIHGVQLVAQIKLKKKIMSLICNIFAHSNCISNDIR